MRDKLATVLSKAFASLFSPHSQQKDTKQKHIKNQMEINRKEYACQAPTLPRFLFKAETLEFSVMYSGYNCALIRMTNWCLSLLCNN